MQQALDANSDAAHVHNRMGLLLATRFKKFSQASEHLMRACELEPNNVVYKNNLGKIIALADERNARAGAPSAKAEKGMLGKLKRALE
jgi:Flp pilus assembly protein TadD